MHPTPTPRRWIDALVVVVGLAVAASGFPVIGGGVVLIGLVFPALQWVGRRRSRDRALLDLVPAELAAAHHAVVGASRLEGVVKGDERRDEADTLVTEVAALLGGRAPRGGAQTRFVAVRVAMLEEMAAAMGERHAAWNAACEELGVDALAADDLETEDDRESTGGVLVAVMLVVFGPAFLVWDLVQAFGRGVVGLVDGIALRIRTISRSLLHAVTAMGRLLTDVVRRWVEIRRRVVAAARESRARFVAARVQIRMRLRLAMRDARRF